MALVRYRWTLWRPGLAGYRGVEELVATPCRRAIEALDQGGYVDSLYLSKHGPREAWLTVFAEDGVAVALCQAVERALDPHQRRPDHCDDPSREDLLAPTCAQFRSDIDIWTRVALDLHREPTKVNLQRELIRVGRAGRTDRSQLEPLLSRESSTYRALADNAGLWSRAQQSCLANTDAIHWLYNVVLGFDWEWGLSEDEIVARLGLP